MQQLLIPLFLELAQSYPTYSDSPEHHPPNQGSFARYLDPQFWLVGITSFGLNNFHLVTIFIFYAVVIIIVFKLISILLSCFNCCIRATDFVTNCIPSSKSKKTAGYKEIKKKNEEGVNNL